MWNLKLEKEACLLLSILDKKWYELVATRVKRDIDRTIIHLYNKEKKK